MDINWGIIGPGKIADSFINDFSYAQSGAHVVYSVLGKDQESLEIFKRNHAVKHTTTDVQSFLETKPDVVYIATPHTVHYAYTRLCLENNIPVLCEKPVTVNAIQLESLMQLSRSMQCFFMEGMWIRFLPSIHRVLELVKGGEVGEIVSVKADMSFKAPFDPESRYFNPELGGGSLLDLGIYPVFLAILLLGPPEKIKAVGSITSTGVDAACSIVLHFPQQEYASLESSLITNTEMEAIIACTGGRIKILSPWNEKPSAITLQKDGEAEKTFPCSWPGRGFQFEIDEVMRCLKQKRIESNQMPHWLSLASLRTMDEVRRQMQVNYHEFENLLTHEELAQHYR